MKRIKTALICLVIISCTSAYSEDWPIYKGNIYFTGNNDEITVKNSNLKWLFQASSVVLNPIASDGMIYFLDMKKNVYALDEETGKLRWKTNLLKLSSQFRASGKSFGKSKYPLIKGDRLFITDNIALYCMNKYSGKVLWARTGMRTKDRNLSPSIQKRTPLGQRDPVRGYGKRDFTISSYAMVDSIYSDPVIVDNIIYYGTRNEFMSREIIDGHMMWNNNKIKSWSKFPSFYDKYIFTQSMDYKTNTYTLFCLVAKTGAVKWKKNISNPHKIYPPVVYKQRVYLGVGNEMYAINLSDGSLIWSKDYGSLITSNPSFTERAILFSLGNSSVVMIDPDTGKISNRLEFEAKSAPYFVTIRDQIYAATTFDKDISGRPIAWSKLEAFGITDKNKFWTYSPQFPGASSQPVAHGGILFLPAGNYLYAVGTDYYPKVVKGGSGYYDPYNRIGEEEDETKKTIEKLSRVNKEPGKKDMLMRKMKISVGDEKGSSIPAAVDVRKWHKGKVIYSKRITVNRPNQTIEIPDMDDVEITAGATGFLPEKVIVTRKDDSKKINLKRLERGRSIVVNNIHFEVAKAYLRKESLNILDRIIEQMKRSPSIKLEVRGHTDSSGGKKYNQRLSERRADSVTEYMIKQGISPERLKSVGMGELKPVAKNSTSAGRRKNRRTEFFVLEK